MNTTTVRWRSVLPLSVVLLTLVAIRNFIIYAGTLQQEELGIAEEPDDVVNYDDHHGVKSETVYAQGSLHAREGEQRVREDEPPLLVESNNDDLRRASEEDKNEGASLNKEFEGFQLFPDDGEAQHAQPDGDAGDDVDDRRGNDGLEKSVNDKDDYQPELRDSKRIQPDHNQNQRLDKSVNDKDDYQPELRDSKRIQPDHNQNPRLEKESVRADVSVKLSNDGVRLPSPIELRDKYDGMLKENSSMIEDEAALMMANMGEVGKIVRNMKRQSAAYSADNEDGAGDQLRIRKPRPLKPHPFKYLINSPKICDTTGDNNGDDRLFIVVYVHTAPDHYKRRMVIRQTWGDYGQYDEPVRLVFVMGVASKERSTQNAAVMFEAERFNDIVQEDFVDSYHNLTHKGVAALRWIDNHCRKAIFVLKTDDDIFINMFTLIRYLKKLTRTSSRPRGVLMCLVWESMPVLREGKWKVTKEEWPEDSYPTYCSGSAFVMSTDVAVSFHRVSYDVPFFWVDDFYITGLLPLKLGNITHRQFASAYVLNGELLESTFTGPQWFTYVFSHVHNLDRIQSVWKTLTQLVKGRVVATIQYRTAARKHPR